MKEKIKKWYACNLWSLGMVKNAVMKSVITIADFEEITGQTYVM